MRNKILGLFAILCAILILFTGTCAFAGTFLFSKSPEILNIITTSPTGEEYKASNILAEIAIDLLPVLWIPEVINGAISDSPTFGASTFSKIPRILKALDQNYNPDMVLITFDTTKLEELKPYFNDLPPYEGVLGDPYIKVWFGNRSQLAFEYIPFGTIRQFYIPINTWIRIAYEREAGYTSSYYDQGNITCHNPDNLIRDRRIARDPFSINFSSRYDCSCDQTFTFTWVPKNAA